MKNPKFLPCTSCDHLSETHSNTPIKIWDCQKTKFLITHPKEFSCRHHSKINKMKNTKEKLKKLDTKYNKDRAKLIENCEHDWIKDGYDDTSKWSGVQWYKCTICKTREGKGI